VLSAAEKSKFRAAQESVVDMLGVPAQWQQTKAPRATKSATVGFKTAGWKDEIIVNSYGINARILTVKARDISNVVKFDTFTIGGEVMTVASASHVYLNGDHIFTKVICKGS
jgi:hypothetical protein